MKNLINLITIIILYFSVGSCERIKDKNVIYDDRYFTVIKLDNGKYIVLPKDDNNRRIPIIIDEKDYNGYKCNFNINN